MTPSKAPPKQTAQAGRTATRTANAPRAKAPIEQKASAPAQVERPPVQHLMLNPDDPRERDIMFAERKFAFMQRRANALMTADMIPKAYKGNMGNCMIALDVAERLGCGEIEVMQNLDVIHGRPAWRAKWLVARVNASGKLRGNLQYVWEDGEEKTIHYRLVSYENNQRVVNEGDQKIRDRVCYAIGETAQGQILIGPKISLKLAVEEGWYNKPGSKWQTMEEKMFMWRAAAWWVDIYMPEAALGFMTAEEATDATFNEREVGPSAQPKTFRSAQELLDAHRQSKTETEKAAGIKEGAPNSSSDPAAPDADADESIVNAMSFEEVAEEMRKATDEEALFLAADLIRSVIDEKERADLGDLFDQLSAKINGHDNEEANGNG